MTETQQQKDERLAEMHDYCMGHSSSRGVINCLRARGVTIEPPPLPEKTYTLVLNDAQRRYLISCCDHDPRQLPSVYEFRSMIVDLQPDERG